MIGKEADWPTRKLPRPRGQFALICHAALALLLPVLALGATALTQVLLIWAWPGEVHFDIGGFSGDTWLVLATLLLFSALAGAWLQRRASTRLECFAAAVVPALWLAFLPWLELSGAAGMASLGWDSLMTLAVAAAPALGLIVGWRVARSNRRSPFGNA